MNIKNITLSLIAGITLLLTSCGGNSKSKIEDIVVKPKSTILKGDLKDYFEVVDKDYKIIIEEGFLVEGIITVGVERTEIDFDFPTDNINPFGTNGSEDYHVGFGIEIFDDSGPVVIKNATEGGLRGPYSSKDVISLMELAKGETGFIRWSIDGEDKLKGLTSFQLTSAKKKENHNSNHSFSSNNTSSKGNENWDSVLKSYESYIDQYISLIKKANEGDMSAMTEYMEMMDNAIDLQEKLEQAGNNLSTAQMTKLTKLQMKFANAAAEMY